DGCLALALSFVEPPEPLMSGGMGRKIAALRCSFEIGLQKTLGFREFIPRQNSYCTAVVGQPAVPGIHSCRRLNGFLCMAGVVVAQVEVGDVEIRRNSRRLCQKYLAKFSLSLIELLLGSEMVTSGQVALDRIEARELLDLPQRLIVASTGNARRAIVELN